MTRHIPASIFAIVAIVGIAAILLSSSLLPGPSFMAVQYVGHATASQGQNTMIVNLDVNELISNEINAISGYQLDGLRSGTVHGKDLRSEYVQSLRFGEMGLFNGGRIVFGETEDRQVVDFLQFQDAIFKYQVEFSPGLRSEVEGNSMPDIEQETLNLLGDQFVIVDTDVSGNSVELTLLGGKGRIHFEDSNFMDDVFEQGVEINGKNIDAQVKIRATMSGDKLTIFSLQYVLNANSRFGSDVEIPKAHCVGPNLQDHEGMLSSNFDICYNGLSGGAGTINVNVNAGSSGEIRLKARGDDEYELRAPSRYGTVPIPFAQADGATFGNRGRNFIFTEAAGPAAANIQQDDYFLVSSGNDVNDVSHVLRYDHIDTNSRTVYFEDLANGDQKPATFDAAGQGTLLMSTGSYDFVVDAANDIAMDQTNDGNINGGEANFVTRDGIRIDFNGGPSFDVVVPRRLFDEPPVADEVTTVNVIFPGGDEVDINIPSPQGVFELVDASGSEERGMTGFGLLFIVNEKGSGPDELTILGSGTSSQGYTYGSSAIGEVYITLERDRWMKKPQKQQPVSAVCGDGVVADGLEVCDPPTSIWPVKDQPFARCECASDCKSCEVIPRVVCGDGVKAGSEQCETNADCSGGLVCDSCSCVAPPPVCGNKLLDEGEQCESNVDCPAGYACDSCLCRLQVQPQQQIAAPAPQPTNPVSRFFLWLSNLFN